MKKIAQFIAMTVTSAISVLAMSILIFRIDLIIDLLNSKPVVILSGLIAGATVGFLVGVLLTYYKLITELNDKKTEVKKLKKDLFKAEKFLEKVLPDVITIRKMQAAKLEEEAKTHCDKRAKEVLAEIQDLSEENYTEDNMPSSET